jgi:glycosyltransferase involved in cell wall biosynthesis
VNRPPGAAERTPRIGILYQCRYPQTRGGAEKWLGSLARALTSQGARVDYLHGAGRGEEERDGVRWIGLHESGRLYRPSGVRRWRPALGFARRAARHLRGHFADYDLVYVHDMPIFPVIASWWALRDTGTPWVVEWIEWWRSSYWRGYAGPVRGTLGYLAQRLALAVTPVAVCYSDLTSRALAAARAGLPRERFAGQVEAVSARQTGAPVSEPPDPPLAVFLGRLVSRKRPRLAVEAVVRARRSLPGLRLILVGQGPEERWLRERAAGLAQGTVEVWSDANDAQVRDLLRRASVLVHPSEREGFGLVVAEANGCGVPVVLVSGPENAAVELIGSGGGVSVAHADPGELADAIVATISAGREARLAAISNAERLGRERSVAGSASQLLELARRLGTGPEGP